MAKAEARATVAGGHWVMGSSSSLAAITTAPTVHCWLPTTCASTGPRSFAGLAAVVVAGAVIAVIAIAASAMIHLGLANFVGQPVLAKD